MPSPDEYEQIGELHDLFLGEETWNPVRPVVQELFGTLGERALVLDVGAGTGLGVRVLASVFPGRIAAVEPSPMMRTGLFARFSEDAGLADRLRVIAEPAPGAFRQLDGPVDGFLCTHMLGHLSRPHRRGLFARLAEHLRPGACGLITADREAPRRLDRPVEQHRRLGGLDYVAQFLPQEDGVQQRYEVRDGPTVLRRLEATGRWRAVTQAEIAEDAEPAGLTLESRDDHLAVLRTRQRTAPPSGRCR